MKPRIFLFALLWFSSLVSENSEAEDLSAKLSGRLVRKYFQAPAVVINPTFGWFVELDYHSKEYMQSVFNRLDAENKRIYSDFDLTLIQLVPYRDSEREACHRLEGKTISINGKLESSPSLYRPIPCYRLQEDGGSQFKEISTNQTYLLSSPNKEHTPTAHLFVTETHKEVSTIRPEAYGINLETLNDTPLELPEGTPEILVTLTGKLQLKLYPGPPNYSLIESGDYPIYSWVLQMDAPSFHRASKTPVWGLGLSLQDIMQKPNWYEVQLGRLIEHEEFCCTHVNKEVAVEGFLFHAHTGHHQAPFLMDVKNMY